MVVAVDYFTKWVKVEALAIITSRMIKAFVYESIIFQYGAPHTIVLDNGKKFDYKEFKDFCDNLHIRKAFSSVARPQANRQVEPMNKIVKYNLKTKLESLKRGWVDELPEVL